MNLEQLNVVELSSEELVQTTGGRIDPITDKDVWDLFFRVTPSAYNRLLRAALN